MPDLLALDSLAVDATNEDRQSRVPAFLIRTTSDGQPLATATIRGDSLEARLRRSLAARAKYPFALDVHDPHGTLLLHFAKQRSGLQIEVFSADGIPLGTAARPWALSRRITMRTDGAGEPATGRWEQLDFRVAGAAGETLGCAHYEHFAAHSRRAGSGPRSTYRVEFDAAAPAAVRALTLGYLICSDVYIRPSG